ncbi:MAG: hypothetical protein ACKO4Z_07120 [Planctomycetota bacterium]
MTFRTSLLVVCMVAVPAAALFSHRVPSGFRTAVRQQVVAGLARCRAVVAARFASPVATGAGGDVLQAPSTPPDSASAATPGPSPAATTGTVAERLARLGIAGFACHPLPGAAGEHVATAQLPLDAGGQLVRVFQATGRDGDQAAAALVAEVEDWQRRAADRERSGAASGSATFR